MPTSLSILLKNDRAILEHHFFSSLCKIASKRALHRILHRSDAPTGMRKGFLQQDIWAAAEGPLSNFSHQHTRAHIKADMLPTPDNLHNRFNPAHPRLFPSPACPFCSHAKGDTHHLLCVCPGFSNARHQALVRATDALQRTKEPDATSPFHAVSPALLRLWFVPTQLPRFRWGSVPAAAEAWCASHLPPDGPPSPGRNLLRASAMIHATIWSAIEDRMRSSGRTLAKRLHDVYRADSLPSRDPMLQ